MSTNITLAAKNTNVYWTSRKELERQFGKTNIERWADLENTGDPSEISFNISEAVKDATDEALSLLAKAACGTVVVASRTLRRNVSRLAAGILYEARGVKDTADGEAGKHRLKYALDRAYKFFKGVQAGTIDLSGTIP